MVIGLHKITVSITVTPYTPEVRQLLFPALLRGLGTVVVVVVLLCGPALRDPRPFTGHAQRATL